MNQHDSHGLGRIVQPDARDHAYPLRALIPAAAPPAGRRVRKIGRILDQGDSPQCVAFAWRAFLNAYPIHEVTGDPPEPPTLYAAAQAIDGWALPHDGTSVRAGAKALQAEGSIVNYYWAFSIDDVIKFLLAGGPLVLGTDWFSGMFEPDKDGMVHVRGEIVGGHAYFAYGVDTAKGLLYCQQSWGLHWGKHGTFTLSLEDAAYLLGRDGEATTAVGPVRA
jgi:hypothetical protein